MSSDQASSRYSMAFLPLGGPEDGVLGWLVIRDTHGHVPVRAVAAADEAEAMRLLERAGADMRRSVLAFEQVWGIGPDSRADPVLAAAMRALEAAYAEDDEGEEVAVDDPRVEVFPDPVDVFVADQPWLGRVLHPLVSIDLGALDPAVLGPGARDLPAPARGLLLSPVEREGGLLGGHLRAPPDAWSAVNWLAFRIEDDGRWRLLSDRSVFEIETVGDDVPVALGAFYADAEADLAASRERWRVHGVLAGGDFGDPTRPRAGSEEGFPVVERLGGDTPTGNWVVEPPPAAVVLEAPDAGEPVLRLADGRPFRFVAATPGYPWRDHGADAILLFVETETRTALLTFDWS
ncbi:hypothetical protein [Cellulomonas iranensis]|uniref:Uncharacterized protein n=1 Tax=Cellulomonas iranensis TaxID=76862 RepID=A0ABU0GNM2_9CELL|nr:hypothetical protein [Cellulomonas iranensis]MDQ0426956.1 hypothetical protein [Cellulomonas iranensis]